MATYNQAQRVSFDAFNKVNGFGAVVLQARPKELDGQWVVEVEIASPIQVDERDLEVENVKIVLFDHGVEARSVRRNLRRPAP